MLIWLTGDDVEQACPVCKTECEMPTSVVVLTEIKVKTIVKIRYVHRPSMFQCAANTHPTYKKSM